MKRNHLQVLSVFVFTVLLLGGCSNSTEEVDVSQAPDPIPTAAFTMDTQLFASAPTGTQVEHFSNARLQYSDISLAVTPFLLMAEAASNSLATLTPVADGGEFKWNTSVNSNGRNWNFILRADPGSSDINWRLFVTASSQPGEPVYDNFELFSATTDLTLQSGEWQVYYPISGQRQAVLSGEYVFRSGSDKEITFNIPTTTVFHPGDQIVYTVTGNTRKFFWKEAGTGKQTTITWDATTKAGNIVSDRYNGGVKACWDTSLKNTTCTA